ncbi:MAG: PhnD/SsuA/transferrin family substrate-binding protein [Phycisphaerae bacterium]
MRSTFFPLVATLALTLCGCKSGGIPILNIIPISNPVNVLYITDSPIESATVLLDYEGVRKAMSDALARPVRMEPAFPILAEPGLRGGWQDLAFLTPVHYAQLDTANDFRVAAYVNLTGVAARPALFVVKSDSNIQSLTDLKGKQVAFGPTTDARTYHAALVKLKSVGVTKADLKKQVVRVPGALMSLKSDAAVVAALMNGSTEAGVVDTAFFTADCDVENATKKAESQGLRVLDQTVVLPDRLVVSSPKIKDETFSRAQAFFENAGSLHEQELEKAGIRGFSMPVAELNQQMHELRQSNPIAELFQPKPTEEMKK